MFYFYYFFFHGQRVPVSRSCYPGSNERAGTRVPGYPLTALPLNQVTKALWALLGICLAKQMCFQHRSETFQRQFWNLDFKCLCISNQQIPVIIQCFKFFTDIHPSNCWYPSNGYWYPSNGFWYPFNCCWYGSDSIVADIHVQCRLVDGGVNAVIYPNSWLGNTWNAQHMKWPLVHAVIK